MTLNALQILEKLKIDILLKPQKGEIVVNFANVAFNVQTKDLMGTIIQEWFGNWMKRYSIQFYSPSNTQSFPDFILGDGTFLEVKTFDSNASPNFDVANFDAYTRSLLTCPERLDSNYLIFSYNLTATQFEIKKIWLKKVWQITGPSKTNCLNLQVKQGIPVNIRPKTWYGGAVEVFSSRKDFIDTLNKAINKFEPKKFEDWQSAVVSKYKSKTSQDL